MRSADGRIAGEACHARQDKSDEREMWWAEQRIGWNVVVDVEEEGKYGTEHYKL